MVQTLRAPLPLTRSPRRAPRRWRRTDGAPEAGPIVKWVGGKGKLAEALCRRAPGSYRRYFEPFAGGAALFFRLAPRAAVLADVNVDLIGCYRAVQDDVEAVIAALEGHRARHSTEHYYAVRETWNAAPATTAAERAAAFIYLNKTCYNGLWRVNSRGLFNVPAGRYVNPGILDAERLRAAAVALRTAVCETAPFERVLEQAQRGDFVYFDPPYHPLSDTSDFTSYSAGGFSAADQERLAEVFAELDDRGCAVMLSNSDTPFTRRLYARHRVERVLVTRAVNSRADRRGAVGEIVVRNRF
jgi:DNA adenine methylase